ncbi:MAG: hypothetical protein ACLT49_05000, partial [Sutterella wadsworthensis]
RLRKLRVEPRGRRENACEVFFVVQTFDSRQLGTCRQRCSLWQQTGTGLHLPLSSACRNLRHLLLHPLNIL